MLEETNKIDMITRSKTGELQLVITDAGMTIDPGARYAALVKKLGVYVGYLTSETFAGENPGIKPSQVQILVMCRIPATQEMLKITEVTPTNDRVNRIKVLFQTFPGM